MRKYGKGKALKRCLKVEGAGDDAAGFAAAGALTARKKKRGDSQEPLDDAEAYGDALFDEDTGDGSLETLHGAPDAAQSSRSAAANLL